MVRRHRRFELLEVTLDGAPMPNATIDVWEDPAGPSPWVARVLMKVRHAPPDGLLLTGTTREGRALRGRVRVGLDAFAHTTARTVLVELIGHGPLVDAAAPEPPMPGPQAQS